MSRIRLSLIVALAASVVLAVPACNSDLASTQEEARAQSAVLRSILDASTDAAAAATVAAEAAKSAEAAAGGVPGEASKLLEAAERAAAVAAEAAAAAQRLEIAIAASEQPAAGDEPNPGRDIGEVVGSLVPGLATAAPFIGGLLWSGVRQARAAGTLRGELTRSRTATERIVRSIDVLAELSPEVAQAFERNRAVVSEIQGPVGKAAVDAVQGKTAAA